MLDHLLDLSTVVVSQGKSLWPTSSQTSSLPAARCVTHVRSQSAISYPIRPVIYGCTVFLITVTILPTPIAGISVLKDRGAPSPTGPKWVVGQAVFQWHGDNMVNMMAFHRRALSAWTQRAGAACPERDGWNVAAHAISSALFDSKVYLEYL